MTVHERDSVQFLCFLEVLRPSLTRLEHLREHEDGHLRILLGGTLEHTPRGLTWAGS